VTRVREQFEVLPRRELLEALAREYHSLKAEHAGAAPESHVRHRAEKKLLEARERFDRMLDEWVPEDDLRTAWRDYLDHHAPEPDGPPAIRPLVFCGQSEARSIVEVRGKAGEELAVEIDGSLVERVAGWRDFASPTCHVFRFDGINYEEIFRASPDALAALAEFVAEGGTPPWEHASELLRDGLIDAHVALTPRGRRALARRPSA
jgi:hypothetical protein